jgi:hypothetical protein
VKETNGVVKIEKRGRKQWTLPGSGRRLHFTHGTMLSLVYEKLLKADVWALQNSCWAVKNSESVNKIYLYGS